MNYLNIKEVEENSKDKITINPTTVIIFDEFLHVDFRESLKVDKLYLYPNVKIVGVIIDSSGAERIIFQTPAKKISIQHVVVGDREHYYINFYTSNGILDNSQNMYVILKDYNNQREKVNINIGDYVFRSDITLEDMHPTGKKMTSIPNSVVATITGFLLDSNIDESYETQKNDITKHVGYEVVSIVDNIATLKRDNKLILVGIENLETFESILNGVKNLKEMMKK